MQNKSIIKVMSIVVTALLVFTTAQQVSGKPTSTQPESVKNIESVLLEKIDINTADLDALTQVKGIGEKKAQRIIDYREKNGAFKDIDELVNVKGIGEKSLQKFKEYLTVS